MRVHSMGGVSKSNGRNNKLCKAKKSKHVQQLASGASEFKRANKDTSDETVADESAKSDEAILLEEVRDLPKKQK